MFVLVAMKDLLEIPPWKFKEELIDTVTTELNKKLANKVVYNVGLLIALFDITHIGDAMVFPGKGACHVKVEFRFVVFRPFIDEILVGEVRSCSSDGVHVSLGYKKEGSMFDDIFIPADCLPHPHRFDEKEQLWVWEYPTDEGNADLFIELEEQIRFRVIEETFVDCTPLAPEPAGAQQVAGAAVANPQPEEDRRIPYSLTGTVSEPGLGLLSWWTS